MINKIEDVNFYKQNIRFVDDLNLDELKTRYGWILNSSIQDAVIGQTPDKKLIWYCGIWNDGIWKDGIWCSGIWNNGEWWDGEWFSYEFSTYELINYIKQENQKNIPMFDIINKKSNLESSAFKKGRWKDGLFHLGRIGVEASYDINDDIYNTREPNKDKNEVDVIWENGIFENGSIVKTLWKNGIFKKGYFYNSIWENGEFYKGLLYNSIWENGSWYGGDFMKGEWYDGIFSHTNKSTVCRFGFTDKINSKYVQCIWKNGNFYSGEWFNGYKVVNSKYTFSGNNDVAVWYNGTWHNGTWNGGMFLDGTWLNGIWKNGVFGVYSSIYYSPVHVHGYDWDIKKNGICTYTKIWPKSTGSGSRMVVTPDLRMDDFKIDPLFIAKHADKITRIKILIDHEGFYSNVSNLSSSSPLKKIYSQDDSMTLYIKDKNNKVIYSKPIHGLTRHGKRGFSEYILKFTSSDDLSDIHKIDLTYRSQLNVPKQLDSVFTQQDKIYSIQIKFYFETDELIFDENQTIIQSVQNIVTKGVDIDTINKIKSIINYHSGDNIVNKVRQLIVTNDDIIVREKLKIAISFDIDAYNESIIQELRDDLINNKRTPVRIDGAWDDGTAVNATIYQQETTVGYAMDCNFTKPNN